MLYFIACDTAVRGEHGESVPLPQEAHSEGPFRRLSIFYKVLQGDWLLNGETLDPQRTVKESIYN